MSRYRKFAFQVLSLAMGLFGQTSYAVDASSRFFAVGGIGQSTTVSADGLATVVEAPFSIGFSVDKVWTDSIYIYGEHMRSLGLAGSGVGLTGLGIKYYPWLTPQHLEYDREHENKNKQLIKMEGYAYFIGASVGIGQASIPSIGQYSSAIAVATYLNAKAGVEFPLGKTWGLSAEGNYAHSVVGSGIIENVNVMGGIYIEM